MNQDSKIQLPCPNEEHSKMVNMEIRQCCTQCLKNGSHKNHMNDLEDWDDVSQVIGLKQKNFHKVQEDITEKLDIIQQIVFQIKDKVNITQKTLIENLKMNDEMLAKGPKTISDSFKRISQLIMLGNFITQGFHDQVENFRSIMDKLDGLIKILMNQDENQQNNLLQNNMSLQNIKQNSDYDLNKYNRKDFDNFAFDISIESQNLNKYVERKKSLLRIYCNDVEEKQVNQFKNYLLKIKPDISEWKFENKIIKTISVPYPGQICAVCSANIINQPQQYYSPFKNEHVCSNCAEYQDASKIGLKQFKYIDTLIFINGPLKDNSVLQGIESYKIGNNLKPTDDNNLDFTQRFNCNGCHRNFVRGSRYIAANASQGFVDYCSNCFKFLKKKGSQEAKKIIEKDIKDGVTEDTLFIRILFNTKGYHVF